MGLSAAVAGRTRTSRSRARPEPTLLAGPVLGEPALGVAVGKLAQRHGGSAPRPRGRRALRGSSVAAASPPSMAPNTCTTGGRPGSPPAVNEQAGGELVRRVGRPPLPGLDHGDGVALLPLQVQGRGGRCRNRPQRERHDAELAAAGAAQRPEQVAVPAFVAVDDAAVGEDDLRGGELVAGEPVPAAEDAEAAAEDEPGDPDGRAAAGGDRDAVRLQRVVDVAQPRPGADRRDALPRGTTAFIGLVSRRIPRVEERPAKQWPPERTARSTPEPRAKAIVSATSAGVVQRTMACGRTSAKSPIGGRRTDSYPSAPGTRTSPAIARCSSASPTTSGDPIRCEARVWCRRSRR